jgi:hypothetical protein
MPSAALNNDMLHQSADYLSNSNLSPKYNSVFTVTNLLEESYKKHNIELAQSYQQQQQQQQQQRGINSESPSILVKPSNATSSTTTTTYNFNSSTSYPMSPFTSNVATSNVIASAQPYIAYTNPNLSVTSSNHVQLNQNHHNAFATQYYAGNADHLNAAHYSIGPPQTHYSTINNVISNTNPQTTTWYSSQTDPRSTSMPLFQKFCFSNF